jgi:predicted lactoylglutathione lyase
MKFLCLGYADETAWDAKPSAEVEALIEESLAYDDDLWKSGNWIGPGEALQGSKNAKTLRWKDGRVVVTDGPFAETKEQLGGLGVLEARDMEHAVELMSRHPCTRMGIASELRPVDEAMMARVQARMNAAVPPRQIFVNLPVNDLSRSIEFFTKLGYKFNAQYTDETATCMIVSESIFVMLLTEAKFKTFTPKAVSDARQSTEVLVCLTCASREGVDELVRKAIAAGGSTYAEAKDYGFMYQHGFQDLDGHLWELVWMNPKPSSASEG